MSHAPLLYAVVLPLAADAASLQGLEDGDWVFVREAAFRGYYCFTPGAVPPGMLPAPGGYLEPVVNPGPSPYQHVYGGLYCTAGATPQTLSTIPSKLTCWTNNSHSYLVTDDIPGDQLVIQVPGTYQILLTVNGTASANKTYDFHPYKNAAPIPGSGISRQGSAAIPLGGTSNTFETFAAGDTISAYGSVGSTTGDITITEASLSAVLMG